MVPGGRDDERRRGLRRLDDLLDALEELNLKEDPALPAPLRDRLKLAGIDDPDSHPIPALVERVLDAQEQFMIKLEPDRRVAERRSRPPLPAGGIVEARRQALRRRAGD
jgi:hypothetical protein